ncbi:MAG: ATP synthase F1 subunit epsilon [Lachnospiraceae bacterium]
MADAGKLFRLKIISPDRMFYDDDVEMVELRTTEGEMGILKGHIPLTAILVPGILKIKGTAENGDKEAALHSGFVEVMQDHVTILAESCEWPEEIDLNRAKEAQIRAERRLKSGDASINIARAELALRRSLIRIELAEKRM